MSFYRRDILAGLAGLSALSLPSIATAEQTRSARIIVALADNKYQGIVPTTATLGNGQSARTNLYWGALYGVKTYFKRHKDWTITSNNVSFDKHIIEKIDIQNTSRPDIAITAEAWDGKYIETALSRFYTALSNGKNSNELVVFIGHNTLMDDPVEVPEITANALADNQTHGRKAIMLACKSAPYFTETLEKMGVEPYVMTRGLMAPEAYTLEAALKVWMDGGDAAAARKAAAEAYAKYQKIPTRNANRLFGAS